MSGGIGVKMEISICFERILQGVRVIIYTELAQIWKKIRGNDNISFVSDPPFEYDVQKRVPSVEKAKDILGFTADTDLDVMLDEVIPWVTNQIELGNI